MLNYNKTIVQNERNARNYKDASLHQQSNDSPENKVWSNHLTNKTSLQIIMVRKSIFEKHK